MPRFILNPLAYELDADDAAQLEPRQHLGPMAPALSGGHPFLPSAGCRSVDGDQFCLGADRRTGKARPFAGRGSRAYPDHFARRLSPSRVAPNLRESDKFRETGLIRATVRQNSRNWPVLACGDRNCAQSYSGISLSKPCFRAKVRNNCRICSAIGPVPRMAGPGTPGIVPGPCALPGSSSRSPVRRYIPGTRASASEVLRTR